MIARTGGIRASSNGVCIARQSLWSWIGGSSI